MILQKFFAFGDIFLVPKEREQPCGSPSDAFFKTSLDALTLLRDFNNFAPEGEPRPVIRVRARRCVIRVRIGETATRERVAVRTTDNTAS